MVNLTVDVKEQAGPDIVFDCPACGERNVAGHTSENIETGKLLHFIPVLQLRHSWVTCSRCGRKFASTLPLSQLAGADPAVLQRAIRYRAGGAGIAMAIIALLTCLVPGLGLVTSGIALWLVRGTDGWPKKVGVLAMVVSVALAVCVVLLFAMDHFGA